MRLRFFLFAMTSLLVSPATAQYITHHDYLNGFVANEHINWVAGPVATNLLTSGHLTIDSDSSLLRLGDTVGTDFTLGWDGSDIVHTISAGDFVFTGGKVAVGTATPGETFVVYGDDSTRIECRSNFPALILTTSGWSEAQTRIINGLNAAASGAGDFCLFTNPASKAFSFVQNATHQFTIGTDGNIDVPNDDQHVAFGAAQDYTVEWDGDDAVHTISAGDFVFTGGDVGIGTVAPDARVEIAGAFQVGDGDTDTNYMSISATGNQTFTGSAGFYPHVLSQDGEPAAGTGATQIDSGELMIWIDTNDGNKVYLVYNNGGTVVVELME